MKRKREERSVLVRRMQYSPDRSRSEEGREGEEIDSLVTERTLVPTPDYKEDGWRRRRDIAGRLRNNAPPPALVSSHGFNRPGVGWPAGSHYFRQLSPRHDRVVI